MWLYLQWGAGGPVYNVTVEANFHNTTVAGGCALTEYASTCAATGYCPEHYQPDSCGGVLVEGNVRVNGTDWPAEALAIQAAAGARGL